jgi:hypothetical protein
MQRGRKEVIWTGSYTMVVELGPVGNIFRRHVTEIWEDVKLPLNR